MLHFEAPAKINLYLRIARRRDDGYHEIETLFQRLELADSLGIQRAPEGCAIACDHPALEGLSPSDNLIARAWEALRARCGDAVRGVRVELDKRIPAGGGLGGGSSDAATMLRAMREMFSMGIDDAELAAIATTLGADVPFFLGAPCAVGRGIGEQLEPAPHPARCHAVLAFPDYGVPTAEVYRHYDPEAPEQAPPVDTMLDALKSGNCDAVLETAWNEMEPLAFAIRPALGQLREHLERRAKRTVRMTGSGSTLFTLCSTERQAQETAADWAAIRDLNVCVSRFTDSR